MMHDDGEQLKSNSAKWLGVFFIFFLFLFFFLSESGMRLDGGIEYKMTWIKRKNVINKLKNTQDKAENENRSGDRKKKKKVI